ncbi:MAG: YCF48-related protein [bacterium]
MKFSRLPIIIMVVAGLILITVALQVEKPSVQLQEMRPERLGTHFRAIRFSPDKRTVWAVGFEGMIVRSDDVGNTWTRQKSGVNARLYGLCVLDRNILYCCGSEGTLLSTTNGGNRWYKIPVPTRLRLVDVFFIDPLTGWVAGDDGLVMHTKDGGKNWTLLNTGVNAGFRRIWFKNKNEGFAAGYEGKVLSTDNGGDTWTILETPGDISCYGAYFDPGGNTCFLVGSCGMILSSTDAGESWRLFPAVTTSFLRDIDFDSEGNGCAIGYGVALTLSPGADRWRREAALPGLYLQSVAFGANGVVLAAGHWGTLMRSVDHGSTWNMMEPYFAPDLLDTAVDQKSKTAMAVGADGWAMIHRHGDDDWTISYSGSKETLKAVAADQYGRFWALNGSPKTLFRYTSQDGWATVNLPIENDHQLNAITFAGDSLGFIAGDQGTLLYSKDAGETWKLYGLSTQKNIHGIYFIDEKNGFMVGDDGLIMESGNGGSTWLGQFTGVTYDFRSGIFSENGYALALSNAGLLESWSNGRNSSWHNKTFDCSVTAIAQNGRYLGLGNGDILDAKTRFSRCVSIDPIQAFASEKNGKYIWGAGRYGRICRLTMSESDIGLLSKDEQSDNSR